VKGEEDGFIVNEKGSNLVNPSSYSPHAIVALSSSEEKEGEVYS
jgi:hypothetical protein